MRKSIILLLLLLIYSQSGQAGSISSAQAQNAAVHFFTAHYKKFNPSFTGSSAIIGTTIAERYKQALFYIFNMSPCGWIAISADDGVLPVIAYSFEGSYTGNDLPPQYVAWMKQYEDALFWRAKNKTEGRPEISAEWTKLLDAGYETAYTAKNPAQVYPMLTSGWGQGLFYNGMCPADVGGPGGHTLVGCVPVAMGQILHYYRWPLTGKGSYSYTDPKYGLQSVDFGATTYQWGNMTDGLTRSNEGVATLLYHLGVSCDLVYGTGASGMYNHKAAYALRTYFKYSPQTAYLFRDSTTLRWDSVIVAHLNRGMPMYYAGWSLPNVNGHAFVCDGYQDTTYFHFNWGWNGTSNGYFHTANPSPPGYNFRLAQELIINGYPDTTAYTYPSGCQGKTVQNFLDGSVTDGSGPLKPYSGQADCSWLISPQTPEDSVSNISIAFNYFNTNPNDFVKIYDGAESSAPLLGSFSGDTVPAAITSTGNKVLITFKAGGGPPGKGFLLSYSSTLPQWCSGNQLFWKDTLDITNGSYGFNYSNNTFCKWTFFKPDSTPLTVYFKRFDTEPIYDVLTIYDLGSETVIGTVSGRYDSTSLPVPVTAPSGKMQFIFSTNKSVTGKGWEVYYPKKNTGVNEMNEGKLLLVFPNPAVSTVKVEFFSSSASTAEMGISSADGRSVIKRPFNTIAGKNTFELNTNGLNAGLYFVCLKSAGGMQTTKLIITKH